MSDKKKNNHFVPRVYLRRFCSTSAREIGLYNLKSDKIVARAPIKSQCSRDYFYSKDPRYEDVFAAAEAAHKQLLDNIIAISKAPTKGSVERTLLYEDILFQEGRTATTVARLDHMTEKLGKAMLEHGLKRDGKHALLEALPHIRIGTTTDALLDTIRQYVASRFLIDDLDCTLILNATSEDFLTSDHPIALCNSLPESQGYTRRIGLASRGLIILYPVSPRALLFLSDAEVYKVNKTTTGVCTLKRPQEVIDLNLGQCANADENLYFASSERVQATIDAFRNSSDAVRPARPALRERQIFQGGRKGVLLDLPREIRRLPLPKAVRLRYAVKTKRFQNGDGFVRDFLRAARADSMTK